MEHNFNGIKTLIVSLLLVVHTVSTAQIPVPAPEQEKTIMLQGGTIHTGNGEVIANGLVVFEKGIILYAGITDRDTLDKYLSLDPEVIKTEGRHIYPGLIALNTTVGLTEIDAVRASRDFNEVGDYNPHVRAVIAYNPESKIIPTLRHTGILMVQATPTGGVISGKSSLMQLDAWNWEDAVIEPETGIHLHWPVTRPGNEKETALRITEIEKFIQDAERYASGNANEINLRLEAMKPLFNGEMKLFIHADDYNSISAAVTLGARYGLKMVIVGGRDSWKLTRMLKENDVAVVLSRVHRLPGKADEAYDLPYRTPAILHDSGVLFCISDINAWQQRNLPFQAGSAVAYGLSLEDALASVTLNPARILGLDSRLGSLEKGKIASLVISEGDLLDMRTNNIHMAFVEGRKLDLTNPQKELYLRYREKYR